MTTQHAPHTPPLWRRVLSLPHTRLGWWAVGLLGISLMFWVWAALPIPSPEHTVSPPWLGAVLTGLLLITGLVVSPLAGLVVGSLAVGAGERSMLVWAALVPAAVFFILLCSVFREGSFWVTGFPGVLIWAVIAFGIIYLRSQARSS